jgi:hypothetical protein
MGTTAEKIAPSKASQTKSKIDDLFSHRAARQILVEARLDEDEVKELISKSYDPCHAVYIMLRG